MKIFPFTAIAVVTLCALSGTACRRAKSSPSKQAIRSAQERFIDALFAQESREDVALRLIALRHGIPSTNAFVIRGILYPAAAVWPTAIQSTSLVQLQALSNAVLRPFEERVTNASAATGLTPVQIAEIGLDLLRVNVTSDSP